MPDRSPEEIRTSVEATRRDLTGSLHELRSKVAGYQAKVAEYQAKVAELKNWRKPLAENRNPVLGGAAAAGFVVGGGLAATVGLVRGKR